MTKHRTNSAIDTVKNHRLKMAIILGALTSFGPLSLDMYLPGLPEMAEDLNTNASLTQLSITFCLLGLSLGQLAAGPLSDVYGRRKPILIGLVAFIISSLLCALSTSIEMLLFFRLIQGLAGATCIVTSRAVARDLYSGSDLTQFMALLTVFLGAVPILAPVLGGQLMYVMDWHGIFYVLSGIGIVFIIMALFALPETLTPSQRLPGNFRNTFGVFRMLIGDRSFIGIALSQGFITAGMFAYISGSTFVLQNVYGMSPQMFSLTFAINGLGIIIASQITGRLARHTGEIRLFRTGIAIAATSGAVLLLSLVFGVGLWIVLPALFVIVSCTGIVSTSGFSLALQNQGKNAGSASALLGVASFVFGAITAPLVGLGDGNPALSMSVVISSAHICSILAYLLLVRRAAISTPLSL